MSLLDTLYQQAILEHYKNPRNHGPLDPHDIKEEGLNPSCGDELTLYLNLHDGVLTRVTFEGEGCAISQATASMMTKVVTGRPVNEVLELADMFRQMLHGAEPDERLGELAVMRGVAKLPARVKCAALSLTTLEAALQRAQV